MLGKLRFTQDMEVSARPDDIVGKDRIAYRIRACLGISSLLPDCRLSTVSADRVLPYRRRLLHDLENISLLSMHEFRMSAEYRKQ